MYGQNHRGQQHQIITHTSFSTDHCWCEGFTLACWIACHNLCTCKVFYLSVGSTKARVARVKLVRSRSSRVSWVLMLARGLSPWVTWTIDTFFFFFEERSTLLFTNFIFFLWLQKLFIALCLWLSTTWITRESKEWYLISRGVGFFDLFGCLFFNLEAWRASLYCVSSFKCHIHIDKNKIS